MPRRRNRGAHIAKGSPSSTCASWRKSGRETGAGDSFPGFAPCRRALFAAAGFSLQNPYWGRQTYEETLRLPCDPRLTGISFPIKFFFAGRRTALASRPELRRDAHFDDGASRATCAC